MKKLRKAGALLIALVLALGMSVTVMAASLNTTTASLSIAGATAETVSVVTSTSTVTITGIPVEAITAGNYEVSAADLDFATYQIAYATYDSDSNSLEYHLTSWAYAALVTSGKYADEDAAIEALVASKLIGGTADGSTDGTSATEQSEILNTLAVYVASAGSLTPAKDTSVTSDPLTWTVNSSGLTADSVTNGTTATASLPVGAYLVLPSSSNMVFLNMLVSVDTSATTGTAATGWALASHGAVLKGNLVTLEKTVTDDSTRNTMVSDGDTAQAQVGDTLYYSITVDVPKFAANSTDIVYKVTDTPTNMSIDLSSVVVTASDGTELKAGVNYEKSLSGTQLVVDFSKYYMSTFYNSDTGIYPYDEVTITYEAELLSTAVTTGNENTAVLTYGNETNSEKATKDTAIVYTYQLELIKYGEDDDTPLSDASFKIYTLSDGTTKNYLDFVQNSERNYTVADNDDSPTVDYFTTDSYGEVTLIGLDAGVDYYIEEYKAPSNYSLNTNYLKFNITGATDSSSGDLTGAISSVSSTEYTKSGEAVTSGGSWSIGVSTTNSASLTLTLSDTKLISLPSTGGPGTILFTIIGCAVMISVAGLYIRYRRRTQSE
ncbi:MAG: LPXTG cell wall anchor domain-containing protein [Clostridiales bacterium]|nr:LPXTG cell wall anchor domain-containing protein [Clostridiales bacterium]